MQGFDASVLKPVSTESKTAAVSSVASAFAERFFELRQHVGAPPHPSTPNILWLLLICSLTSTVESGLVLPALPVRQAAPKQDVCHATAAPETQPNWALLVACRRCRRRSCRSTRSAST